jgi:SAM-dependent methyltransferase
MINQAERGNPLSPRTGSIDFGDFRRLTPFCRDYGESRGMAVDRFYIEAFLSSHSNAIRGDVLEISESTYTRKFGGEKVSKSDVLHYDDPSPPATLVGDLCDAEHIPSEAFDCVIVTQTLMLIYDVEAAIATIHRVLKPGGTALITVAGVTQVADPPWIDRWCWSFTRRSMTELFGAKFGKDAVEVETFGNVLTSIAFLHGLAAEELTEAELKYFDPEYPMIVGVAATKPA